MYHEVKQAQNVRHEIEVLSQTLAHERQLNHDLQQEIIHDRKRSDAMCTMMTLIRTETEAVLRRHNVILGTPGARIKAADLHKKAKETTSVGDDADHEEEMGEEEGEEIMGDGEEEEMMEEDGETEEETEEEEDEEDNSLNTPAEITVKAGGGEEVTGRLGDDNDDLEEDDDGDELEVDVDVENARVATDGDNEADADAEGPFDTDEEEGEIKEDDDDMEGDSGDNLLSKAKRALPDDDTSQNEVQEDDDVVDEEEEAMSMNNTIRIRERSNSVASSALDAGGHGSQHAEDESDSAEEGEIQEDEGEEGEEGEIQDDEESKQFKVGEAYQPVLEVILKGESQGQGSKLTASQSGTHGVTHPLKKRRRDEMYDQNQLHHPEPTNNPFDDDDDDDDDDIVDDDGDEEEEGEIHEEEEGEVKEHEEEEGQVFENEKNVDGNHDDEEGEIHEDAGGDRGASDAGSMNKRRRI